MDPLLQPPSVTDLSLLLLSDTNVPQYASLIITSLVAMNQTLHHQVELIQSELRSLRDELRTAIEERKEQDKRRNEKEEEMLKQQRDGRQEMGGGGGREEKRNLAFSVYLREMPKDGPTTNGGEDTVGGSGTTVGDGNRSMVKEEYDEEDIDVVESEANLPGQMSAETIVRNLQMQLGDISSTTSQLQPSTVSPSTTVPPSQTTPSSFDRYPKNIDPTRRSVLPCPRSDCEVILYSELGFSAHLRVHDGRMPFECTNCGREFRLRDGLVKHMRTHTGERPYPCQVCGKNFKRVHHRKKHLQAKHITSTEGPTVSDESCTV